MVVVFWGCFFRFEFVELEDCNVVFLYFFGDICGVVCVIGGDSDVLFICDVCVLVLCVFDDGRVELF